MFNNYEIIKFSIPDPGTTNLLILIIFATLVLCFLKGKSNASYMDVITTDQARGICVFAVVLGHLWVHVANSSPNIFYLKDALAIFLLISGYGISKTIDKNTFNFHTFLKKRINRIMVPYWAVTMLILLLDYLLLDRSYKISHIVLTLLGINLYGIMYHFDYIRWYITFLLFWYLVAVISIYFKNKLISCMPFIIGVIFFILDYYILKFGWSQYIAFPLGWWLGRNEITFKNIFIKLLKWRSWGFLILLLLVLSVEYLWLVILEDVIPSIFFEFGKDVISSLVALSVVGYLSVASFFSRILVFLGRYSYEAFLLHGVFLIKYNPFFEKMPFLVSFVVYFTFIITISWIMNKSLKIIRL
jgi:peptidoglycan/LPS O-acetylase OafA/YrhL